MLRFLFLFKGLRPVVYILFLLAVYFAVCEVCLECGLRQECVYLLCFVDLLICCVICG